MLGVLAVAGATLLTACSPLELLNAAVPDAGFALRENIAYGKGDRHRLDVYEPAELRRGDIVVLFVYGGSWRRGDRADYRFVGQALSARGYRTVIPDYSLYPEARFPLFVEDVARAVAWCRVHLKDDNGQPVSLVLAGHSAGAHIAALTALDDRYLRAQGVEPASVVGLIGLAGPYAFRPSRVERVRDIFSTAEPEDDARPVSFAHAKAPPSLLVHGLDDTTVRPENSRMMAERLTGQGASVRLLTFEGAGHIAPLLALSAPFQDSLDLLPEIERFLRNLREPGAVAQSATGLRRTSTISGSTAKAVKAYM